MLLYLFYFVSTYNKILIVAIFIFFSVSQTITVGKNYFKRELRGLGLRSELVSEDPHLEIEVAKHSTALVFSVANVKYKRESIFGDKVDYFDKKLVPIPDARNVPLDKFLILSFRFRFNLFIKFSNFLSLKSV